MAKKKQEQEASWFEPVTGFFGGLFGAEEEEKKPELPPLAREGQPEIEGLKAVAEGGGAAAAGAGAAVAGAAGKAALSAGDIEMQMPEGKDVDLGIGGGGGGLSMGGGGGGGDGELGVLAWVATGLMGFTVVCFILMMALSMCGAKNGPFKIEIKATDLIKTAADGKKSVQGQVIFSFIIIGLAVSLATTVLVALQKIKGLIAPMKFPTIGLAWFTFVSVFIALMLFSVGEETLKLYVKNIGKTDASGTKFDPALYIGWIFMVIGSASSLAGAIVTTLAFLKAE